MALRTLAVLTPLLALGLLAGCGEKEVVDSGGTDADGDGYTVDEDCDDDDASSNPGAAEVCDGVDNDCDGVTDNAPTDGATFYTDADGDGYGDAAQAVVACEAGGGLVDNDLDCDDTSGGVNPDAQEYCDGVDNDCDGELDEPDALGTSTYYADSDGDGFGDPESTTPGCDVPEGYSADRSDCDDASADVNPDADEICDGVDNNCADGVDEDEAVDALAWYRDLDEDGYGNPEVSTNACSAPSGFVADDTDCYDNNPDINPGAAETWYDGRDSSCHNGSDYDADQDGYDSLDWGGDDCDDTSASAYPGNTETWYDGVDGDCDGLSDYDADGDLEDSSDYEGTDCDDADAAVNTAATETWYDGVDQNCDGWSDYDADYDWYDSDAYSGDDCDDADRTVHPYAWDSSDDVDSVDDDCSGTADDATAVAFGFTDDDSDTITLTGSWSFDICGDSFTDIGVQSNGQITLGFTHTDFSESTSEFLSDGVSVAPHWDDFYPPGADDVYYVEYADAVAIYWPDASPCCSSDGGNTFSVVLHSDDWFQVDHGASSQTDGIVGFSCATDSAIASTDISEALYDVPEGSIGLGQGTEAAYYEYFSSGFDLADTSMRFCGWSGTDADADGWTDDCGDPDDADASVTP